MSTLTETKTCPTCEKPFNTSLKHRKYCDECREKAEAPSSRYTPTETFKKTCDNCYVTFTTGRANAKFCTRYCKELAGKRRRRKAQPQNQESVLENQESTAN